jgi:hypothetical protein
MLKVDDDIKIGHNRFRGWSEMDSELTPVRASRAAALTGRSSEDEEMLPWLMLMLVVMSCVLSFVLLC